MTGNLSRRRKASVATVAGTLLAIVAFTAVNAALVKSFEYYDGNTTNEAAVTGVDWDQVYAEETGGAATGMVTSYQHDNDYTDERSMFTSSSKDVNDISTWAWRVVGEVPDKTDLLNALAAKGGTQLYFAADRYATNGDAKVGFWFLKDSVSALPDGTFGDAEHKTGDIMIESLFPRGGKIEAQYVKVYKWVGGNGTAGHLEAQGSILGGDCTDPGNSYDVCLTVNQEETTSAWGTAGEYVSKFSKNGTYKAGAFIEGAINLAALYGANVPCFGSFIAETRSSGSSVTSELKDFVLGEFDTCARIIVQKVRSGGSASDTFDYTTGGTLKSFGPDRFELTGATSLASVGAGNKRTFLHVEPGTYSVRELALDDPWVLTNIVCTGGTTTTDGTTQSVRITAAAGQTITCTFYNLYNMVTTRTQGFWSTHPTIAAGVWGDMSLASRTFCGTVLDTNAAAGQDEVMGGFWSNVASLTTGAKRSALGKARMTLLQQLLAAMLNQEKFGATDAIATKIATAKTNFCSGNIGAVNTSAGEMGAYNESGDTGVWSPGEPADPTAAQKRANLVYWNVVQ